MHTISFGENLHVGQKQFFGGGACAQTSCSEAPSWKIDEAEGPDLHEGNSMDNGDGYGNGS